MGSLEEPGPLATTMLHHILHMNTKLLSSSFYILVCFLLVVEAQDETEKPLLKCYECAGVNNVCGSSSDLGTVTTCPAVSETCIVATNDNGDVLRMCGREDEYVPKCVNDDTFCWCTGELCNSAPGANCWTLSAL